VLTARAWLSPSPGAGGLLNGKTHVGASAPASAAPPSAVPASAVPASPGPAPPSPAGTSTMARAGRSAVGSGPASSGQIVGAAPCTPASSSLLLAAVTASRTVPPSNARTGR
jgi:hypothetical protein